MVVIVIKGGQLSLRASVIARCGALVLMCLFGCKQLFLHFLILMITGRCVIFGFPFSSFLSSIFLSLLNTENMEGGGGAESRRERTQTNYGFGESSALVTTQPQMHLFTTYSYAMHFHRDKSALRHLTPFQTSSQITVVVGLRGQTENLFL